MLSALRSARSPAVAGAARFYSSTIETVPLAFTLHKPPADSKTTPGTPLVVLHGLFGSKSNNRSISK